MNWTIADLVSLVSTDVAADCIHRKHLAIPVAAERAIEILPKLGSLCARHLVRASPTPTKVRVVLPVDEAGIYKASPLCLYDIDPGRLRRMFLEAQLADDEAKTVLDWLTASIAVALMNPSNDSAEPTGRNRTGAAHRKTLSVEGFGTYTLAEGAKSEWKFRPNATDHLPDGASIDFDEASKIRWTERDERLDLHKEDWEKKFKSAGWGFREATENFPHGSVCRMIDVAKFTKVEKKPKWHSDPPLSEPSALLHEFLFRFPSAPIFGTNRRRDYQVQLQRPNFHTMRLIRRPFAGDPPPVRRVYLLHNGLNETDNLQNYYRLAYCLFRHEELEHGLDSAEAACILRPIPGHLTRYPFPGEFAEKPMDRYILDAGDLFRQFLRFMLETQWLLSSLVPYRDIRTVTGLNLIAKGGDAAKSRLDAEFLAESIQAEWAAAYDASTLRLDGSERREDILGGKVSAPEIQDVIERVRHLLGWQPSHIFDDRPPTSGSPPFIHTLGYSLGGFFAQSAFFTWPCAIATCTMLNSGGALGGLHVSGFAHEEEWKGVLHALRYELESAFVDGRLHYNAESQDVGGLRHGYFETFLRTFYEVFLQDFEGEYKSRVSEYASRLLFVVGGKDPVVTPRSVIERGPAEGLNLIEIANLPHELHSDMEEWRDFWFPKVVAKVVSEFSVRGEKLLARVHHVDWNSAQPVDTPTNDAEKVRRGTIVNSVAADIPLTSREMEHEFGRMLNQVLHANARLFAGRNVVPEELLGDDFLKTVGIAMHHEEGHVAEWERSRRERRDTLANCADKTIIVIPKRADEIFQQESSLFRPYADATGGQRVGPSERKQLHDEFRKTWLGFPGAALFLFDPMATSAQLKNHSTATMGSKEKGLVNKLLGRIKRFEGIAMTNRLSYGEDAGFPVNTLPDSWVMMRSEALKDMVPDWDASQTGNHTARAVLRTQLLLAFVTMAEGLASNDSEESQLRLNRQLEEESIQILKISRSEYNPRFRGYRVFDGKMANRIIVHTALAYARSEILSLSPCLQGRSETDPQPSSAD